MKITNRMIARVLEREAYRLDMAEDYAVNLNSLSCDLHDGALKSAGKRKNEKENQLIHHLGRGNFEIKSLSGNFMPVRSDDLWEKHSRTLTFRVNGESFELQFLVHHSFNDGHHLEKWFEEHEPTREFITQYPVIKEIVEEIFEVEQPDVLLVQSELGERGFNMVANVVNNYLQKSAKEQDRHSGPTP